MKPISDPATRALLSQGYFAWTDLWFGLAQIVGWPAVLFLTWAARFGEGSPWLPLGLAVTLLALLDVWIITLVFRAIFFVLSVTGKIAQIAPEAARNVRAFLLNQNQP